MPAIINYRGVLVGANATPQTPNDYTILMDATVAIVDGQMAVNAGGVVSVPNPAPSPFSIIGIDATGALQVIAGTDDPLNESVEQLWQVNWTGQPYTAAELADIRREIVLGQPALTWAFSFLSGALSNADPGNGNFGFDSASNSAPAPAHLYISYTNAQGPSGGGVVGLAHGFKQWLLQAVNIAPFYLRIWSRKDPTIWGLYKVTDSVDHSTYADVAVTFVRQSNFLINGPVFPTDELDAILAFDGFVSGPIPESGSGTLGADVSIPSANTFVDGPTVTPAGGASATYLLTGHVTIAGPAGADTATVRLTDGTTVYAEGENSIGASSFGSIYLSAIVPGNATYKFTVAHTSATAATIKRDPTVNSSGAHVGSKLSFVRIA